MVKSSDAKTTEGKGPPRVVILGGGYGGVYAALGLQKAARRGQIELSLISRNNFFVYQPMLAEVVSGSIEPPHIVNPIRRLARFTNFYKAEIEAVDVQNHTVIIRYPGHPDFHDIQYDHLVIAVGSSTDLSRLPGMAEHAFPFRTLGDALFLRNHLISVLESAEVENDPDEKREALTFVVAGGGYTGVEVAAEINDFTREAVRSYTHIEPSEIKVMLLQGGVRIMPEIAEELAEFSHRVLERRGVEIRLNTRIMSATAQSAILDDGTTIPTRTLVAAVGAAPNRLLDSIPSERDSRGRIVVDETLAVPGYPGIWAVGDCAAIPDAHTGGTAPPTAQYALREAKHLAKNILATIRGGTLRPFLYKSMGSFVPLGRFSAAAQVMGFKVSGFPAWWMYRTYYLSQLPRLERKLRVMIDWTLELLFHRDIVQMEMTRSEGISRAHYEAGEVVYQQGDLARNFWIILDGQVQVFRQEDGQETLIATLGTGEYFGEMSLLRGVRHTASVRTLTPVDLLVMNEADFTALASSSTRFGELLAGVMRQRLSGGESAESSQSMDNEG
ncbi:MAG: FAD-dependent oxidoreductase [Chloroflexi bacterium]|nr:FAD-dependent oxidoreductase [Chloroflexota bacterium]